MMWLQRSAQGEQFTRYHGEAAIAAEHCMAPSFDQTRWDSVAENYQLLEQVSPSPLYTLNRAIAVAEWQGPEAGLEILEDMTPPDWLRQSCQWLAAMADLHLRCGNDEQSAYYVQSALEAAPTPAIKVLLEKRFNRIT